MASAVAPTIEVKRGEGRARRRTSVDDCTIERDIGQPDMATLVLANQSDAYSATALGAPVVVAAGGATLFDGEVIAVEPTYRGGGRTQITLRAVNHMHRLARTRRSMTFVDKTDRDIIAHAATAAGLDLRWQHDAAIAYQHVYQHDQADLDHVRSRAARLGCHVWCVGRTLFVQPPQLCDELGIHLSVDADSDGAQLRAFTPRMSAAGVVGAVTVKGWNPETKQPIVGHASAGAVAARARQLGAAVAAGALGNAAIVTVDHPVCGAGRRRMRSRERGCRRRCSASSPATPRSPATRTSSSARRSRSPRTRATTATRSTVATTSPASRTAARRVTPPAAASSRPSGSRATRRGSP